MYIYSQFPEEYKISSNKRETIYKYLRTRMSIADNKIVCPKCKGKLLDIVYGMPGPEMFEKANKHEVYLGGCCITEHDPKYFCPK